MLSFIEGNLFFNFNNFSDFILLFISFSFVLFILLHINLTSS